MKISVVMQSYLSDYPGSRSRPKEKFIRAVNSFLSQTHEDKELVIIADGCELTKQIYDLLYSDNPLIKFVFVAKSKNIKNMYEKDVSDGNTITYYRGTPRRIGCSLATGDLITYFDSDDIILPNRLSDIYNAWKDKPESVKWSSNPFRLFHENWFSSSNNENIKKSLENAKPISLLTYGIKDKFYLDISVDKKHVSGASYAMVHRKNVLSVWRDMSLVRDSNGKIISGTSEDVQLMRDLMNIDKCSGFRQESASIVICHYRGIWDV